MHYDEFRRIMEAHIPKKYGAHIQRLYNILRMNIRSKQVKDLAECTKILIEDISADHPLANNKLDQERNDFPGKHTPNSLRD